MYNKEDKKTYIEKSVVHYLRFTNTYLIQAWYQENDTLL